MRKMHKHIVNKKKLNVIVKRKYLTNLTTVLNTLWLKRSASQFTFYKHSLTDVSLNTHQSIDCSLLNWFADLVNALVVIISSKMKNKLQDKLQIWQNNNCLRDEPTLNLNNWLHRVRRLWVLSMFSMLKILKATKDLTLTEIEDCQKGWICNQLSHLYNLQRCNLLYEVHVSDICLHRNTIKIAVINHLIQVKWDLGEKAVFCTMRPTVTLVLYWVRHYIKSCINWRQHQEQIIASEPHWLLLSTYT